MPTAPDAHYWIERLHQDYLARGKRETTWQEEYRKIYRLIPDDAELTADLLHQIVIDSPVNSRTRVRTCMAIGVLARFAGVTYNPNPYKGKYSPKAVQPRQIPTDQTIAQWFGQIKNPGWRWFYGMVATYGLRPHEVFHLDLDRLRSGDRVVHIGDDTKTGFHRTWAFHPEWFDEFKLGNVTVPNIKLDRINRKLGESADEYFRKTAKLPFVLYDMRHAWAIRTTLYGIPDTLAAQQMGHSLDVHNKIYQRWVGREIHQSAYESAMNKADRPKAPKPPKVEGSES
jgi:hypothetical protein